jgi:GDP-L-fucose synthase
MREFLYVEDLADAVKFALENVLEDNLYNVGTGRDLTIKELAEKIQNAVGYEGEVIWDHTKPDGTPRKLMDVSKLKEMGWVYKTDLEEGIKNTYEWFQKTQDFKQVKL